jgi:hypothetical protein
MTNTENVLFTHNSTLYGPVALRNENGLFVWRNEAGGRVSAHHKTVESATSYPPK